MSNYKFYEYKFSNHWDIGVIYTKHSFILENIKLSL